MVALVGCFTAYLVHGSPDQDFPSGRGGIYFWICVGVLILAPVYLLDHLFGRERGNALATGVVFTLFCVGPLVLMAWPASLNLLYAPQEPTTWESVGKALGKTGGFAIAWSFITGLFALGAWWSAWSVFAKARKR
jgi:hypothetical protein